MSNLQFARGYVALAIWPFGYLPFSHLRLAYMALSICHVLFAIGNWPLAIGLRGIGYVPLSIWHRPFGIALLALPFWRWSFGIGHLALAMSQCTFGIVH